MRFGPAYEVEERRWRETHDTPFPTSSMNMTNWVMPNAVFDRDFFKIKLDDNVEVDYCEDGCIFSIKEML